MVSFFTTKRIHNNLYTANGLIISHIVISILWIFFSIKSIMSKTNHSYRESQIVRVNYTKVGLIKAKQKKVRRGSPLLKKVSPQDWDSDWGSLLLNQQWQPLDFFALWEEDTGSTWPIVDCLRSRTQLYFKFWKVDISMILLFIFQDVVKLNIAV